MGYFGGGGFFYKLAYSNFSGRDFHELSRALTVVSAFSKHFEDKFSRRVNFHEGQMICEIHKKFSPRKTSLHYSLADNYVANVLIAIFHK